MKYIASFIFLCIAGFCSIANANNVIYVVPQPVQPVPVLQLMVYQSPYVVVTVPVVVRPETAVQQGVIWGYPYQPVIVPVNEYHYWGYDKRCRLINKY